MSLHDDDVSMAHMLDHALEAVAMIQGRSRLALDQDRMLNLAIVRLLEIVGEAANRVSEPRQEHHPEIPWPQIVGMRNRIIHGYDRVDMDIVWNVLQIDLPPMIAQLKRILGRA